MIYLYGFYCASALFVDFDKVTMVRCAVLVLALLLASVWVPADSQSGMYTKIYRQRRPVNSCSDSYYSSCYKLWATFMTQTIKETHLPYKTGLDVNDICAMAYAHAHI